MSDRILIIAGHDGATLHGSTARAVACASEIAAFAGNRPVDVLVLADDGTAVAEHAADLSGVARVLQLDHMANGRPMASILAPQIVDVVNAGRYSHLLGPNTTFGKDLLPRVAALLGAPMVTDLMTVHGTHEFSRPVYAGNAVVTVRAPAEPLVVASVRCASYAPVASDGAAEIQTLTSDADLPTHTRFVDLEQPSRERPDLQTAARVVSGGRALGSEENFRLVYEFADRIGAAVGASREAVDAGFAPNDMQIGQTGKIIAPELYICFGISGAIQHLAGIKDAGTIVAINQDADAPIFDHSDIGLVGDLFEIIPEFRRKLG